MVAEREVAQQLGTRTLLLLMCSRFTMTSLAGCFQNLQIGRRNDHTAEDEANRARGIKIGGARPSPCNR